MALEYPPEHRAQIPCRRGLQPDAAAGDPLAMLIVFEVHLTPGADGSDLLSEEIREETMAQVMTLDEARAVGFGGTFPDGDNVRLVAVTPKDARWIEKALERAPTVVRYGRHEVAT